MNIYEKLIDIQTKLKVEKTKYNDFGKFDYRSAEDILQAVKPYLAEHKLLLLLTDEIKQLDSRFYVEATATLTDGEAKIETKASAREPQEPKAKMDESQTTGSTSSYARKYALNGLFALDDGNDSDSLNKGEKKKKASGEEKLITKEQIKQLKSLGFTDERLLKMAQYYKVESVEQVTYKQADEAIKKQKKAAAAASTKGDDGNGQG